MEPTTPTSSPTWLRWPLRLLAILGAWLALEIVMIGLAFAFVAVYSYAIAPGKTMSDYEAFAQSAVPWFALAASAPVFGVFGFACTRTAGPAAAVFARLATAAVVAFDVLLFVVTPGVTASEWGILLVAATLKGMGVELGGWMGARGAAARA